MGKAIVLINRMSLRSTAAVGAATLVAGATFAVTAFADDDIDPDTVASAAIPEAEEPAADGLHMASQSHRDVPVEGTASIRLRPVWTQTI